MSGFEELPDLASERLGGLVLAANDDFFAPKESLVRDAEPVWKEGEYTDRGKWMDGWETRRRREPGHDWCLLRLGLPGVVRGVVVDTSHFRGNFPEACAIEVAELDADPGPEFAGDDPRFRGILERVELAGDSRCAFAVADAGRATHLLMRIFPDGGVARLRVHGEVAPDRERLRPGATVDLAAIENGGRVVEASDMFFGHRHHLVYPGPSRGMFDGWETKRRRGPGHDWAVVALGARGTIERVVVDTSHFKGNAPGAFSLEVRDGEDGSWHELAPRTSVAPDREQSFDVARERRRPATRARLNIFPDGGVARLRLLGAVDS